MGESWHTFSAYMGELWRDFMSLKISSNFLILALVAVLVILTAAGGRRLFLGKDNVLPSGLVGVSTGNNAAGNKSQVILASNTSLNVDAQDLPVDEKLDGVLTALSNGNADELSKYFDSYIDLSLPDRPGSSYSRIQAKMVLRDFFDSYHVKRFSLMNGVASNSSYYAGTLETAGGKFKASMYIRRDGTQPLIREFDLTGLR